MKYIVTVLFLIFSSQAFSQCNVFIPQKTFYHDSGYAINFEFSSLLYSKGYVEVFDVDSADSILEVSGEEVMGRFHRAKATFSMNSVTYSDSVLCLTHYCSISDYGKAFRKVYKKFSEALSNCH
jgi:hypothetical protein